MDERPGFFVAFLALVENPAEGGGGGWAKPTRTQPGKPGCGHVQGPGPLASAPERRRPRRDAPTFLRAWPTAVGPAEVRWRRGWWVTLGVRRGAAAFGGPGGPAKPTQGRGPKAPAPALCALCAPAAPPGTPRFSAVQTIHPPPFPALPSRKPNEPAAPDERRASIIRCKPRKVFQQVFPRFFQKRKGGGAERRQWRKKRGGSPVSKGVEGSRLGGDAQRPLRTARGAGSPPHAAPNGGRAAPRMKPPTGSRGRAPAGTHPPYLPTQKREKIRWITASSTVLPVMRPKASRALRRSVAKQSGSGA